MSKNFNYNDELREILKIKNIGNNNDTIKALGTIIEKVLEQRYIEIFPRLNSGEKQELVNIERKLSKKKTPIETLGLGNWISFYEAGNMPNLISKYFEIDSDIFNFKLLKEINEIRNKCTHIEVIPYQASQEEVQKIYNYTVEFLKKNKLIEKEPMIMSKVIEEEKRSRISILTEKIRIKLASDPIFEFKETFDTYDNGKFYDVWAEWEFVGAIGDDDKKVIHIILLERINGYHLEVQSSLLDTVEEMVLERLKGLDLSDIDLDDLELKDIKVHFAYNISEILP